MTLLSGSEHNSRAAAGTAARLLPHCIGTAVGWSALVLPSLAQVSALPGPTTPELAIPSAIAPLAPPTEGLEETEPSEMLGSLAGETDEAMLQFPTALADPSAAFIFVEAIAPDPAVSLMAPLVPPISSVAPAPESSQTSSPVAAAVVPESTMDPLAPLAPLVTQAPPAPAGDAAALSSAPLTPPSLNFQGSIIQIGDDFSARARLRGYYFLSSNALVGATVDLSTGDAFSDTGSAGFNVSELYLAVSPGGTPNLRFWVGQLDLTSFFDRNSFAKDSLTHFIDPVFQTNPALAATQIRSRPAALIDWRATDNLSFKAAAFSSGGIDDFDIDGFAGEAGLRLGNLILRGTYVAATDSGDRSTFPELFAIDRGGTFGPLPGDREIAYGLNAEWYIPSLRLGIFGRYGYQENQTLGVTGETYSGGINLFDLFMASDRLGIGYGWGLSDSSLRQQQGGDTPDVLEVFYDFPLGDNVRAAIDVQQRNDFSETVFGFRVRANVELLDQNPGR